MSDIRDGMNKWQRDETDKFNKAGNYGIPEHVKASMSNPQTNTESSKAQLSGNSEQLTEPTKIKSSSQNTIEGLNKILMDFAVFHGHELNVGGLQHQLKTNLAPQLQKHLSSQIVRELEEIRRKFLEEDTFYSLLIEDRINTLRETEE